MGSRADNFCIAIVDDDESFRRSLARMLRAAGYQLETYPSAEEFLADPAHARFSCLLVDVKLGGMTGPEMQGELASEGSRTPIIFITAYEDPVVRATAFKAGCHAFFQKTDDGARLLESLNLVRVACDAAASTG
jgi:FixJ family two-component response regulator